MRIRRAEKKDTARIHDLLEQVEWVHHTARPDLFRPGGRKYTDDELAAIMADDSRPIFVAVDEDDRVLGYAFCISQDHKGDHVLTDVRSLYIDDLCVDENIRGKHVGRFLYDFVVSYARERGYYNVTLNVWEGNDRAKRFYESMGLKAQKTGMEFIL